MPNQQDETANQSLEIAKRWCISKGAGWRVLDEAGRGGTAPVYAIDTPSGKRAFKLYDEYFSTGSEGTIQELRVDLQKKLGDHDCPTLVKVYDGGRFEDRLFVLMSLAPGRELEKELKNVPRSKIRKIVSDVARAAIFLNAKGYSHRDIKSANIFVSDDYNTATLLDISVLREIHDPVGLGTDHGNQLPMIATARYSPPEYLFRLLDPNEASWKALTVYQIGTVLYDLIMREPLFEEQYKIAGDNRYRFAWAVATVVPQIKADDVDRDLILLARRALEKDWEERVRIPLSDFLDDVSARRSSALKMLGFDDSAPASGAGAEMPLRLLRPIAQDIDTALVSGMLDQSIRATHAVDVCLNPPSATIQLDWPAKGATKEIADSFRYRIKITGSQNGSERALYASVALTMISGNVERVAEGGMPTLLSETTFVPDAVEALRDLLGSLGMKIADSASEDKTG